MELEEQRPDRAVCIHGHFYQPPRDNPWTGKIEKQESAAPFHDWNERITSEAYQPNAVARILATDGSVEELVCNYSKISFDFGPTLLSWMEKKAPSVYQAVIDADHESLRRFGGHGSAMAQAYHHCILPLANRRDKVTEIRWGIRDFEYRFGRKPEGLWLPETAVDLETLEILAGEGIRFTVLSPYQAASVRAKPGAAWIEASGGRIDARRPYVVRLLSGRKIAVFFYNGQLAKDVAFNGMLYNGEVFALNMLGLLDDSDEPQLANIATDGETYGHHHRFGEMALAYALRTIERTDGVRTSVYGEFLGRHPAEWEVRLIEDSAWSCAHGVGRWASDCGCNVAAPAGWNQQWRAPLRECFNWLRDVVAARFEEEAAKVFCDPWAARDDYISVLLGSERSSEFLTRWLIRGVKHSRRPVRLMELQRNALRMFTSCGWFFNDVSGIETAQILSYALRLVEQARDYLDLDLEAPFLDRLAAIHSNLPDRGTARDIVLAHNLSRPAKRRRTRVLTD